MNKMSRTRQGLTLIELTVVIGLLSLVIGGTYKILISGSRIAQQQQQEALATQRAWDTLQQISRELQAASPPLQSQTSPDGVSTTADGSTVYGATSGVTASLPSETIRFRTRAATDHQSGNNETVQYAIRGLAEEAATGLYRRSAEDPDAIDDQPWKLQNDQTIAMEFQYLNPNKQWIASWDRTNLPHAVRIRLWLQSPSPQANDDMRTQTFMTTVHLPSALQVSR